MRTCLLIATVFLFSGCIKNYCWTCTTSHTSTYSDNSKPDTVSFTNEICDGNIYDIDEYEEQNSYSTTIVSNGVTQVVVVRTSCEEN